MIHIITFAVITLVAAVVVFFGGAGMMGYVLFKTLAKGGGAPAVRPLPQPSPPSDNFSFAYSPGMSGDASEFEFPHQDGVHYVLKRADGVALGKTINFKFEVSGDGELSVADRGDIKPATFRLILWGRGGDQDRWFTHTPNNIVQGENSVSVPVEPSHWGPVGGGTQNVTPFETTVQNLLYMGFTFGGQYFAGHGVFCPAGNLRFKLIDYSVS